jgi:predicted DNA-binding transcriptional regulator AlpA
VSHAVVRPMVRRDKLPTKGIDVADSTLHDWIRHNEFPRAIVIGKWRYWFEDELAEWQQKKLSK